MNTETLHCVFKSGTTYKQALSLQLAREVRCRTQQPQNIAAWLERMAALPNYAKPQDIMPATAKG